MSWNNRRKSYIVEGFYKNNEEGPYSVEYMETLAENGRISEAELATFTYEPAEKAAEAVLKVAKKLLQPGKKVEDLGLALSIVGGYSDPKAMAKFIAENGYTDASIAEAKRRFSIEEYFIRVGDSEYSDIQAFLTTFEGMNERGQKSVLGKKIEAVRKCGDEKVFDSISVKDLISFRRSNDENEPDDVSADNIGEGGTMCFLNDSDKNSLDNERIIDVMVVPQGATVIMSKDLAISQVKDVKIDGRKRVPKSNFKRMKMRKDWAGDATLFKGNNKKK